MNDENIEQLSNGIKFEPMKNVGNGIYLNISQVDILNKYNIDFKKCNNLSELIYNIELYLNSSINIDNSELEWVCENLSEFNYYNNTNK